MPPAVSWCEAPLAPSLRELLSEREAEGVYSVGCCRRTVSTAPTTAAAEPPTGRRVYRPPRGKPRGSSRELTPFNVPLNSIRQREAKSLPYGGECKITGLHHPPKYTPSVSYADSSLREGAEAAAPQRDPAGRRFYRTSTSWVLPALFSTRSSVSSPYTMDSFRSISARLSR